MSTPENGGTVRYNVKDLLQDINTKLDRVIESLNQKAERSDVHELKGRVAALEKQAEVSRMLASDRESSAMARADTQDKSLTRKQQIATSFAALASTVAVLISGAHWLHFH